MQGRLSRGFTLIELMVTLVVSAILLMLAIPSFNDFRERVAVRGAADQLVSFWANAKLEALKRNRPISVTLKQTSGDMCIGASTSSSVCDCFTAAACDVGQFPSSSAEKGQWNGVLAVGAPTLGDSVEGLATIDPKRGNLSNAADVGGITIQSPAGQRYQLSVYIDRWGRPQLCSPSSSPMTLPDYATKVCAQ